MESEERPTKMRKLDSGEGNTLNSEMPVADQNVDIETEPVVDETNGTATYEDDNDQTESALPLPSDTAAMVDATPSQDNTPVMSKNQMKKLRKQQEWDAKKEDRKALRNEKMKAKRERKKVAKQQEAAAAEERGEDPEELAKAKRQAFQRPSQLPVTFLIDCDFDDLMRDNERVSLGAQVTRCYSDNKNSKVRAHLTICSFGGKLRERYEGVLMGVYKQWRGVRFLEENFVDAAEIAKEWMCGDDGGELKGSFSEYGALDDATKDELKQQGEVVYLSSEADDTLTELRPYSTYIIGGLVDKNREKGICYKRATKAGVRTAKLPIGQYLEMTSRKVLATNHVHEIMVKWLDCRDWGEAFMQVIPKRKGGKLLDSSVKDAGDDDGEVEEAQQADEATVDTHEEVQSEARKEIGEADVLPEESTA